MKLWSACVRRLVQSQSNSTIKSVVVVSPTFSTMTNTSDEIRTSVCVVGAGLMGSSTAYAAAKRLNNDTQSRETYDGKNAVTVLEQYSLLHRYAT